MHLGSMRGLQNREIDTPFKSSRNIIQRELHPGLFFGPRPTSYNWTIYMHYKITQILSVVSNIRK